MITYKVMPSGNLGVYLNGKLSGRIRREVLGYRYYPKGSTEGGELFGTIRACKKSLKS